MAQKLKIRKSIIKRFKLTGTGKVVSARSFNRHLRSNKSKSQMRRLAIPKTFTGKAAIKLKKMLGAA